MDFEARQIVVAHREIWQELSAWARRRGMWLHEIEACREGDLPTYAFGFTA